MKQDKKTSSTETASTDVTKISLPSLIEPTPQEHTEVEGSSSHHLRDTIDWIIAGWQHERPDLDVSPIAIINRLERITAYLRYEVSSVFERFGLTSPSFAVIATLRRSGTPYQLTQRALMDALQLTSGTISVRIDRLERDGIVERLPDPEDQRGVIVRLTEKGSKLFDQVAPIHLANEDRLLSALTDKQREQLASLLRSLLLSFDPISPHDPLHPSHWIGASLAPSHTAKRMRRAAGLPDTPGLLVLGVSQPGPAAEAGLQEGDLIIAANGEEIRSIDGLYEQLLNASEKTLLSLEVLRGLQQLTFSLHIQIPV